MTRSGRRRNGKFNSTRTVTRKESPLYCSVKECGKILVVGAKYHHHRSGWYRDGVVYCLDCWPLDSRPKEDIHTVDEGATGPYPLAPMWVGA